MRRAVFGSGCVATLALLGMCSPWLSQARAETQFNLNPPISAAVNWTTDGVWEQPGFPNSTTHSANLSRPLASPLTANLGSNSITLAGLTMGSTTSAITTSIAGPAALIFQNDDAGYSSGVPFITSGGVPGATIQTVGETRAFFENSGPLAIEPAGAGTRTLSLGADSVVNGMRPIIHNAPDGGVVGVTKFGPGKWELFGNNTYTGQTRVREGQLNIVGDQTGTGETIVDAGATLGGDGTVGGNVTVHGAIAPGRSTGTLQIAGNLTLDAGSEMVIEILSTTPGKFSRLEVAGNATLAGALRIELPNQTGGPCVPKLGDIVPFLAVSGGAGGNFDDVESAPLLPGLKWSLEPGNVTVFLRVIASLPGDYNFNGIVDAADYTVWRDSFGQQGTGLAADGNLDEKVDDADYAFWKSHFGEVLSGAGQSFSDTPAVPEPNCLILFTLAACALPLRRR